MSGGYGVIYSSYLCIQYTVTVDISGYAEVITSHVTFRFPLVSGVTGKRKYLMLHYKV